MTSDFGQLKNKSIALGDSFPIMPIDEISLAVAFAELPNQEQVVERLIAELFDHHNMHVRRIALSACRRSEAFGVPSLQEALTRKLEDSAAWVRYDAVWAIQKATYDSPRIRRLLSGIAGSRALLDLKALVKSNPSDAELQAQARARETLDALLAGDEG